MRSQSAVLPLLLAASAVNALPKNIEPGIYISACNMTFNTGKAEDSTWVWQYTKADDYLNWLLEEDDEQKGPKDWTNRLFRDNEVGGSNGGTSFDCTRLGLDTCGRTEKCKEYDPPEAYLVHVSIANMYSAFNRMHEALQDTSIFNLAKGVDDIVDTFTSIKSDRMPDVMGMLIGIFVGSAALAGPNWHAAFPLSFLVGALNLGNSMMGEPDYEGDLKHQLGEMFKEQSDKLYSIVQCFFTGDFTDCGHTDKDSVKKLIKSAFANGKMLDNKQVDKSVDAWIESSTKALVCLPIAIQMSISTSLPEYND